MFRSYPRSALAGLLVVVLALSANQGAFGKTTKIIDTDIHGFDCNLPHNCVVSFVHFTCAYWTFLMRFRGSTIRQHLSQMHNIAHTVGLESIET